MSLKNTHKLPGAPKLEKVRNITKFPVNSGEVVTNYLQKDIRPLFVKASFPSFLDFTDSQFQLENDDFLKSCTNVIKELNLTSNSLIEVNSLGHLNKLKKLIINKNNLVEVSVQGLSSLVFLGLCNNRLDHFPDLTDCSKKLLNIDISFNRLVEGFDQLSKLKVLKVLDLSNNNITMILVDFNKKIMEHLKKIKTLEYLSFENNPVEKSIDEFRLFVSNELQKLKYLNWIIIGKEERTKAAKLETDGFWVKFQQTQQQQQTILRNSSSSISPPSSPLNSSSSSIPIKPGSGFLQRKPSMGLGMSPKFSPLNRSNDNFFASGSPSTPGSSLGSSSSDIISVSSPNLSNVLKNSTSDINTTTNTTTTTTTTTNIGPDVTDSPKSVPLKGKRLSITASPLDNSPLKSLQSNSELGQSSDSIQKVKPNLMSDLAESFGSVRRDSFSLKSTNPSSNTTSTPNTDELSREECETYLDQLLNELPSIEKDIDFSTYKSFFDQKLFLDLLYRAITEDVIPNELFEISAQANNNAIAATAAVVAEKLPILSMDDEELLVVKPEEVIQPTPTIITATTVTTNTVVPVSVVVDNKQDITTKIGVAKPDSPISPKLKPTTIPGSPSISSHQVNKPIDTLVKKEPIVKPDINVAKPIPAAVKPMTPNPIVNKLKPIAKPTPVVSVEETKPVPEVKPTPVVTVEETKPVSEIKPTPVVSVEETKPVPEVKPTSVVTVEETKPVVTNVEVPKPVVASVKPTPKVSKNIDINVGEFDINAFNFEIEQTLADIESTYSLNVSTPDVKPPVVVAETPKPPVVVAKPIAVVAKPVVTTPPKPVESSPKPQPKGIPHSVLSDISKLQDQSLIQQVENATSKLDEMIEAYNSKPVVSTTTSDEDALDKLITKFENDNKSTPTTPTIKPIQNTSTNNLRTVAQQQPPQPVQQSQSPVNQHSLIQWVVPHHDIQLGSKLGMGGFGDCFSARVSGKQVIVKKIRTQRFSDQFLNQFKEEVTQLKAISNEHLSPVIGCCVDSTIYIVSPFYEGCSLQQYLDNPSQQVTNDFILRVSYQISKAMVALHSKDVIHRALKPNNIIIEQGTGNAYVRDFAFNSIKDSIHRTGHTGNTYMAPELFTTQCNSYESSCDQFSFAMILLQLFTRQTPNASITPSRLGDNISNGDRPVVPDSVPSVFNRLIRACWNQDPSARPTFLTISKILSQPIQRIFTGVPTTSTLNLTSAGATPSNTPPPPSSISIVNNSTSSGKHQFSETGDLKRKMSLVLDKIMQMLGDSNIDVLKKALKALENLSSPENHSLMIGIGLLKSLVKLLSIQDLQDQLLKLLYSLCTNESLSNEFIASNGFEPLAKIMQSPDISIHLLSIKLLTIIADEQHLDQIRTSGILSCLLKYLHSTNELLVMQVVGALSRVLLDFNNQIYFIESGSVSILLEMLKSTHQGLSMRSLLALCCLITNDRCKDELLHAGIIPKLMELLASPQKLLRLHTLKIVQTISKDSKFKDLLVRENCIKLLTDQLNNSSEDALPMILSCLSSILKEQISFNIFYASLGIDKLSLLVNQSITKISGFYVQQQHNLTVAQQKQQQQQFQQTIEILSGSLSVVYSVCNHENSRNKLKPIIPRLVGVLQRPEQVNTDFIVQTLQTLTAFANHVTCIETIEQTMCIPILVSLLHTSLNNYEIKLNSLRFISTLVKMNPKFTQTILSSGVLQIFIDFLSDKSLTIKEESIATISWLTSSVDCRSVFLQKGVLKQLIGYTNTKNTDCIERLLWAISFFASDEPAQAVMRDSNVFDFIIKSLGRDEEVFKTLAIKSVLILVQKDQNKEPLKRFGVISYLKQLETSPNRSLQLASKKIISLLG